MRMVCPHAMTREQFLRRVCKRKLLDDKVGSNEWRELQKYAENSEEAR